MPTFTVLIWAVQTIKQEEEEKKVSPNFFFFATTQTSALPQDDNHPNPNSSFIRSSCLVTPNPALCVHTLSAYATSVGQNNLRLSLAALLVSLFGARLTISFVSRLVHTRGIGVREFRAVKDYMENIGDSVDDHTRLVAELALLGKRVEGSAGTRDFVWHMSNVQTWVSAALTDENTCMDEFGGRVMDGNIKVVDRRVVHHAQVTSNAFALLNRFASLHRPEF